MPNPLPPDPAGRPGPNAGVPTRDNGPASASASADTDTDTDTDTDVLRRIAAQVSDALGPRRPTVEPGEQSVIDLTAEEDTDA